MIQVESLSKSYGPQTLFDEVGFSINSGERIGLVGRNGHGKSTLFKILAGVEEADEGEIHYSSDYTIGYVTQHLSFSQETILDEASESLPLLDGSWKETYKAEAILHGLGFSTEEFGKSPQEFSGGYQVRLHLSKLLLSEPSLLLLDEPTNYLDILAMRWLENFLKTWPRELLLITHDRAFMDSVTTHTLGIHRGKVRKVEGSTTKFYDQLALEEEVQEKSRLNQEKQVKETEEFIKRFRAKASKAKAVQSRVKALEKMEVVEALHEIQDLDFRFRHEAFPGKRLLSTESIAFHYPEQEKNLLEDISLSILPQDRIAIIGKNGRGKSTFLKMLAGELRPLEGSITSSPNIVCGYFGQTNVDRLNAENTIETELIECSQEVTRTQARSIAGLMMFEGDAALKKIKVLSGGERARVLLGKLLLTPSNLLLLDEPSNHLDMQSTDSLLAAIKEFPGAVVFVSHSEMFLRELATRLVVFDRGRAEVFEGDYDDFLRRRGWSDEGEEADAEPQKQTASSGLSKKELRRMRAEVTQRKNTELGALKKKAKELELEITKLEEEIEQGTAALIEGSQEGFGDKEAKLSRSIHQAQERVDAAYGSLEQTLAELEEGEKRFEEELAQYSS